MGCSNLEIYTSMEATKAQAEYIRDGLDYDYWKSNIHAVLKKGNIKKVHMMMTINSLCLTTITEFMDEMLDLREEYGQRAIHNVIKHFAFSFFQSAAILPEHIKTFYKDKLEAWFKTERPQKLLSEGEKASTQRLIDYLDIVKTPTRILQETPKLYNDFKAFFEQFDVRRGHDFREVFKGPIADWYDTLKADVPSPEQILNKELVFHTSDRAGDPQLQKTMQAAMMHMK